LIYIKPRAGDSPDFQGLVKGGLIHHGAPVTAVNSARSDAFVTRGGRISAPLHSFRN
jgi:uncharacterized protein (UPF0210 family)